MSNLAIIPARGGSKRLTHKNIRLFHGQPIIAYSIQAAQQSGLFDEIMVSTDDPETAEIAQDFGASVPFVRSEKNADDHATLSDVCQEVLTRYHSVNQGFAHFCCLLATAPFIQAEHLATAYHTLQHAGYDTVCPVVPFSYPIQRALQLQEGKLSLVQPEHLSTRSQDLPTRYHDAGLFYWSSSEAFLRSLSLLNNNTGGIVISALDAQDIDDEADWQLAEAKFQQRQRAYARSA